MGGFDVVALGELLIDFTHNDMSYRKGRRRLFWKAA